MGHHTHASITQQLLHDCSAAPGAALLLCPPAAQPQLHSPLCQRSLRTRSHKGFQRCLQTCWDSSYTSFLQFKTTIFVRQRYGLSIAAAPERNCARGTELLPAVSGSSTRAQ